MTAIQYILYVPLYSISIGKIPRIITRIRILTHSTIDRAAHTQHRNRLTLITPQLIPIVT